MLKDIKSLDYAENSKSLDYVENHKKCEDLVAHNIGALGQRGGSV